MPGDRHHFGFAAKQAAQGEHHLGVPALHLDEGSARGIGAAQHQDQARDHHQKTREVDRQGRELGQAANQDQERSHADHRPAHAMARDTPRGGGVDA